MTTWNRVQGDISDTLTAYLYGVNTFAGASVEAHVWPTTGGTRVTLSAAVVDGTDTAGVACGVSTVQLGAGGGWLPLATPAAYFLEHQVTFADGKIITWPAQGYDGINVRAQGS